MYVWVLVLRTAIKRIVTNRFALPALVLFLPKHTNNHVFITLCTKISELTNHRRSWSMPNEYINVIMARKTDVSFPSSFFHGWSPNNFTLTLSTIEYNSTLRVDTDSVTHLLGAKSSAVYHRPSMNMLPSKYISPYVRCCRGIAAD